MDLSLIISDVVQSAVTKGAQAVTVSIFADEDTKVIIECEGFEFPCDVYSMRSLGYEYIFEGEYCLRENCIEFVSDYPIGKTEEFLVSILSANPGLKEVKFVFCRNGKEYLFSRNEMLKALGDVYVGEYNVLMWIEEEIRTKTEAL